MSNENFRAPEPDIEAGVTDAPARPAPKTPAEAATQRLRERGRSIEEQRLAVGERRFADDSRTQVFERGARRRMIQTAEGRVVSGASNAHDATYLRNTRLNDEFEKRHGDLLADDRALGIAKRLAEVLAQDAAYAHAPPDTIADLVAQGVRRELAATSPQQSSQTPEARSRYVDAMREQRTAGAPTRGLKTWRG